MMYKLVTRPGAKRRHLLREYSTVAFGPGRVLTECGQTLRAYRVTSSSSVNRVDCYECLSSGLSRRLGEQAAHKG